MDRPHHNQALPPVSVRRDTAGTFPLVWDEQRKDTESCEIASQTLSVRPSSGPSVRKYSLNQDRGTTDGSASAGRATPLRLFSSPLKSTDPCSDKIRLSQIHIYVKLFNVSPAMKTRSVSAPPIFLPSQQGTWRYGGPPPSCGDSRYPRPGSRLTAGQEAPEPSRHPDRRATRERPLVQRRSLGAGCSRRIPFPSNWRNTLPAVWGNAPECVV
jgi:hypothetical protein